MLKAVVDTNVFITALLHGPTPRRVYEAFLSGKLKLVFSPELLAELTSVLTRPSLRVLMSEAEVNTFLALIQRDALIVRSRRRVRLCRDPKDNIVLGCAAGNADFIVTGDKDLLILKSFRNIPILRPRDFLQKLV